MILAVIGIEKHNNESVYKVMNYMDIQKYEVKRVDERGMTELLRKADCINAKLDSTGRVVEKASSFNRFKQGSFSAMVILREISINNSSVAGYIVADGNGKVYKLKTEGVIKICEDCERVNKKAFQNAVYVGQTEEKKQFIRAFPGGVFDRENIIVAQSKHAVETKIDMKENEKRVAGDDIASRFTKEQIAQLKLGKNNGVDIRIYANPDFTAGQMKILRETLEQKLPAQYFADPQYSENCMKTCMYDLKYGIDIRAYASPKFNMEQLSELGLAYMDGMDMNEIADPDVKAEEMAERRIRFEMKNWNKM